MYAVAADPFFRPLPAGLGINTSPTAVSTEVENSLAVSLAAAAPLSGPAAPFLLAAAAIAKTLAALGVGAGCGATCIQATNLVNGAEPNFLANVQQYENGQITQEQAQANYQALVQAMQAGCSAIPGQAGQSCFSDRFGSGSCKWKQTANGDTLGLPGVPAVGECWNWELGYGAPLNYPPVNAPAAASATGEVSSVLSSVGISSSIAVPLMIGAAVLAGWLVLK